MNIQGREAFLTSNVLKDLLLFKGVISAKEFDEFTSRWQEKQFEERKKLRIKFWNKIQPGTVVTIDRYSEGLVGEVISKSEIPFESLSLKVTKRIKQFKVGEIVIEKNLWNLMIENNGISERYYS